MYVTSMSTQKALDYNLKHDFPLAVYLLLPEYVQDDEPHMSGDVCGKLGFTMRHLKPSAILIMTKTPTKIT